MVTKIIRNQTVVITAASACPDFNALADSGPLARSPRALSKKILNPVHKAPQPDSADFQCPFEVQTLLDLTGLIDNLL